MIYDNFLIVQESAYSLETTTRSMAYDSKVRYGESLQPYGIEVSKIRSYVVCGLIINGLNGSFVAYVNLILQS